MIIHRFRGHSAERVEVENFGEVHMFVDFAEPETRLLKSKNKNRGVTRQSLVRRQSYFYQT